MNMAGTLVRAISVALCGVFAIATTGCTVTTRTEPVDAYTYTEPVPDNVYSSYPTTDYDGTRYVWYRDRWIYKHHGRWAYVHDEPEYLFSAAVAGWGRDQPEWFHGGCAVPGLGAVGVLSAPGRTPAWRTPWHG